MTKRERHDLAMSLTIEEKRVEIWYFNMRSRNAAVGMQSQSE